MSDATQALIDDPHVKAWAEAQFAPWMGRRLPSGEAIDFFDHLNASNLYIYRFSIANGEVSIHKKPDALCPSGSPLMDVLELRAALYRHILTEAVQAHGIAAPIELVIDIGDGAPEQRSFPLFTFQKLRGGRNILIPDFDGPSLGYYETDYGDRTAFADKRCAANFSGSTTGGGLITIASIESAPFPRLRAANYFRDREDVDFRLTQIVQCADDNVVAYLMAQGHGRGVSDWPPSFANKFAISIDGNGAACSRPAIALRSNCALMKYASEHVLYYSGSLIPWLHYLPIEQDEDVVRIIALERDDPGRFAYVAQAGREFGMRYLGRDCVVAYTALLLRRYAGLFAG